jgi:membrane-associated phospholipid phosphatase
MTGSAVVLLVGSAVILSVGLVLALASPRSIAASRRWASKPFAAAIARARRWRARTVDRLGPVGAFLVVLAAAAPPIGVLCHLLGLAVQRNPVRDLDEHLNDWFLDQQDLTTWLRGPVEAMNHIANWPETLTVAVLASVALGVLDRDRRWLPALLIGAVVLSEWALQTTLNHTVDPSPPPTGAGLFPSGGTARVIAVYGFIVHLALRRAPPRRHLAIAGWTAIALIAFLQAFARVFAGYHWTSDIPGGVLLGGLILAAGLAVGGACDAPRTTRVRRPAAEAP